MEETKEDRTIKMAFINESIGNDHQDVQNMNLVALQIIHNIKALEIMNQPLNHYEQNMPLLKKRNPK